MKASHLHAPKIRPLLTKEKLPLFDFKDLDWLFINKQGNWYKECIARSFSEHMTVFYINKHCGNKTSFMPVQLE